MTPLDPELLDPDPIDAYFEALRVAIELDPGLSKDLRQSWSEFCPSGPRPSSTSKTGTAGELAARRHLEWFLLEKARPGPDEARIQALFESCAPAEAGSREEGAAAEMWRSLAGSHASIFEVTRVEPGRGVWLWDLARLSECAAIEALGSRLLQPGDVIAGRVFPIGESFYRLSRAAAMWRDPRLLAALREDMERARAKRSANQRGSLRLRQIEIEAMFHAPVPGELPMLTSAPSQAGFAVDAIAEARALLAAEGVDAEGIEAILARLASEAPGPGPLLPGNGDVLGEILEELAFETSVDLESARRTLLLAWEELHAERSQPESPPRASPAVAGPVGDVATAVAEFDRKRREGAPLDEVFRDLEEDLGLAEAGGESEEEDTPAPDFPGVVAAMIEEFLWDERREHGEAASLRYDGLRSLGRFAEGIGVFENLSGRELADYACRWVLENREIADAAAARDLLDGIGRFCTWSQENHEVRLEDQFAPILRSLHESLPRLVEANRLCSVFPAGESDTWLEYVSHGEGAMAELLDATRARTALAIDPKIEAFLRSGDILRGRREGSRRFTIHGCFPGEIRLIAVA